MGEELGLSLLKGKHGLMAFGKRDLRRIPGS
jgi:hypothetical protein